MKTIHHHKQNQPLFTDHPQCIPHTRKKKKFAMWHFWITLWFLALFAAFCAIAISAKAQTAHQHTQRAWDFSDHSIIACKTCPLLIHCATTCDTLRKSPANALKSTNTDTCQIQCAALTLLGDQCSRMVKVSCPLSMPEHSMVTYLCWQHSKMFQLWKNCVERSDYTDAELEHCDKVYGNPAFSIPNNKN